MKTTETRLLQFLEISAHLTGFEAIELQGSGMLETYYETIATKTGDATVTYFFEEVARVLEQGGGDPGKIEELIKVRLFPASCYGNLAQNIISMWYTGAWVPDTNAATSLAQMRNISPAAYVQGLMWPAIHTHPPGAKQPGYGSWAEPPIDLNR